MKKRLLSLLLAVAMLLGMMPVTALADFVIATKMINYVQIDGLDMPIVGELPDREAELIEGSGYTVGAPETFANSYIDGIAWYDVTTDEYMAEGEVFVAGHEYYPMIGLQAKSGYAFISPSAITGKSNLCDNINAGGFLNTAESQYISVCLGTTMDLWSTQPLHRSTISTEFCMAYNADGQQIYSAVEGETVTVRGTPAAFGQEFYGWIIEPKGLNVTHPALTTMQFTMPAEPVTITASYADITLRTVRLFFDDPVAGNEVDFTASNMSGSFLYPGYGCITPKGFENNFFNGVAWWDDTDGRYLKPGDVYQAGHTYQISAVIAADLGYVFASKDNLTVTMYPGGECVVDELYMSAYDSTKHKFVTSGDITPLAPHAINLMGGTAYDQDGNTITEAMPGMVVTIVADEPGFGWEFDQWMFMGDAEIEVDDVNNSTTTFIMPASDVTVFSGYGEAEKVRVEEVNITLYGYHLNADSNCLQVGVSEGAVLCNNSVTSLDYVVMLDNNGSPDNIPYEGKLVTGKTYWLGLVFEPEFGYTLKYMSVGGIHASFAKDKLLSVTTDGQMVVCLKLAAPSRPLFGSKSIAVTGGTAYINHTAVTSATQLMKIRIEADEAPEGQIFSGWKVISGNVQLADPTASTTTFVMGSSAVEIEAIYTSPIDYVAVSIPEPMAGMTPSYLVRIESEGIERDENSNIYCRNGVIWYDVDTEENLDPNTAVFEPGHTYGVQILLKTAPGMIFALNEEGYPTVTGSVNDTTDYVYVDSYTQEPSTQVVLTTSFYIEEDAEIAEPITQITLSDLDAPVIGQPFDYTYNWDFMEYVSPDCSQDGEYTLNGVTWIDITDPQNPVIMVPEVSVAAAGHMYAVEMLVGTTNNRIFSLDKAQMPEDINATLNGEPCNIATANGLHPTRVLKLMYNIPTSPIIEWNVSLSDSIGINFIADLEAEDVVTAAINGKSIDIVKTQNSDGTYKLSVQLAAAQMSDEIKLMINGTPLITTYSVRKYADYILYDDAYSSCHELVKAMLAYGGAAQNYFGYNTENLADSDYTVTSVAPTGTASVQVSGSVSGVSFYGASLVFEDKIAVRFYFAGEIEGAIFTVNSNTYTPVAKDGMYYVEVDDINPQDMGTDIIVTVTKGAEALRVTYSPLAYMIRMYAKAGSSDATKALMQALYGYYLAAVNYNAM